MSKTMKMVLSALLAVAVLALIFGSGYSLGLTSTGGGNGIGVVEQAWNIIFSDYVDREELDPGELSGGAIRGMLDALDDPYSAYLDEQDRQISRSSLEGEIEGIGAQVGIRDEQITIIAPIENSPAEQAGIRAGDVILAIDGESTEDMSLAEAVLKIRGEKGTTVSLLIQHQDNEEPETIEIVRQTIELSSVGLEMMEEIAYIDITHFSGRTDEELEPLVDRVLAENAQGVVLDLRSNPGGVLDTVIEVASYFLEEGVVVRVVDNRGAETVYEVKQKENVIDAPMVVLTDNFSASGSEVLAGALQDYGRAVVAGQQTFGKGSVNVLRQLQDGSGIYLTIARWLTPDGRRIEGEGIAPDIELELEGEEAIQWAIDYLRENR
jgi:carboxyl-terminal processing protease